MHVLTQDHIGISKNMFLKKYSIHLLLPYVLVLFKVKPFYSLTIYKNYF
jgi:hypothetical protein